jgi:hypothetical protein
MRRFERLYDIISNINVDIHLLYVYPSSLQGEGAFTINGIPQIENVYNNLFKILHIVQEKRNYTKNITLTIFDTFQNEDPVIFKELNDIQINIKYIPSYSNWGDMMHEHIIPYLK